jgi:hypothetical protein
VKKKSASAQLALGAIWTIVWAAAWTLGREALEYSSASGMNEIAEKSLSLLPPSIVISLFLALAGAIALPPLINNRIHWFAVSFVSFPLAFVGSYLLVVSSLLRTVSRMGMVLEANGGGAFIFPSPLEYLPLVGLFVAVAQLPILKEHLRDTYAKSLLWPFGSMVSFALGWIVMVNITPLDPVPSLIDGLVMGGIAGASQFLILLVLTRGKPASSEIVHAE